MGNSYLLNDIDEIRLDMREHRGHFGTLVPFLFACNSQPAPRKPEQEPATLVRGQSITVSANVGLAELGICKLPIRRDGCTVDWGASIVKSWQISEEGAREALSRFLAEGGGLSKYESERHLADASAVARISPYLRFGMLSSRTMYWASKTANAKDVATTFWRRLVWRDLAYWQLRLFPHMTDEPIRAHYS